MELRENHLMIIGDIFDRGKDVPQIFWLFYKLEEEAAKAGGHVSFILGNHEPMVLANDLRYTKENIKYWLKTKDGIPPAIRSRYRTGQMVGNP